MSRVFEELERFVPKEHKDEYRKFVAYSVQFKPNDEIGQICHAAGWLALITRETPGAFAKNAEAFLTEWKKEQTQLLRVVGSFKDDQVRLSTKHEELRTLIDEGGRSLAALFTNERAKTSLFLKESRVQETSVKQVCADLKQAVTSAKADIESATTNGYCTHSKRTRRILFRKLLDLYGHYPVDYGGGRPALSTDGFLRLLFWHHLFTHGRMLEALFKRQQLLISHPSGYWDSSY